MYKYRIEKLSETVENFIIKSTRAKVRNKITNEIWSEILQPIDLDLGSIIAEELEERIK